MASEKKTRDQSRLRNRWIELKKNGLFFNLLGLIPLLWGIALTFLIVWGINVSLANEDWYLRHMNSFFTDWKFLDFSNYVKAMEQFTFESYQNGVYMETNYFQLIFNSIWFSVGTTVMKMLSTIFFAYAVARFEFPGRRLLYGFVVLQMMIPIYGQTAANYELLYNLGLVDTPGFLLAQGAGHGMYFLITYSFFRNLPSGYEEAARIDGAGPFRIFWQVMLPQAKPITLSLGIMQFISAWNSYDVPLLYLPSFPTLSSALYMYKDNMFQLGLTTPTYFAGMFISVLPVAVLFIIFNKQIMENVSIGGLKG